MVGCLRGAVGFTRSGVFVGGAGDDLEGGKREWGLWVRPALADLPPR